MINRRSFLVKDRQSTCAGFPVDFFDLKKQLPWLELLAAEFSGNPPSDGVTASGR